MPSLTKVQTGFLAPQGAVELDPGTASAPGLKFSTSSATGMFSPSAGVLGFSTGSTQNALTILANGNVGIGSTNPQAKFTFANAAGRKIDFWNSSSPYTYSIGIEDSELRFSTGYASIISFYRGGYAGTESLRIDANGNVGIGTTNPTHALTVPNTTSFRALNLGDNYFRKRIIPAINGNNASSGYMLIARYRAGTSWSAGSGIKITLTDNYYNKIPNYATYTLGRDLILRLVNSTNYSANRLRIKGPVTYNSQTDVYEIWVIVDQYNEVIADIEGYWGGDTIQSGLYDSFEPSLSPTFTASDPTGLTAASVIGLIQTSSGNVGIGTPNPITKLDVRNGVITAGSNQSTNGSELLRGYYSEGALTVIGSEHSSGGAVIGYAVKPSTSALGAFLSSTSITIGRGAYSIDGNAHRWYAGSAQTVAENSSVTMNELMRLTTSGNVGIGTTNPGSKLDVQGSTNVTAQISLWGRTIGQPQTLVEPGRIYATAAGLGPGDLLLQPTGGNIGIGTTSASERLHLHNADNGLSVIRLSGSAVNQTTFNIRQGIVGVNNGGFSIYDVNNSVTRFAIDPSGNIGIGTGNPSQKLHIENGSTYLNKYGDNVSNSYGLYVNTTGYAPNDSSGPHYGLRVRQLGARYALNYGVYSEVEDDIGFFGGSTVDGMALRGCGVYGYSPVSSQAYQESIGVYGKTENPGGWNYNRIYGIKGYARPGVSSFDNTGYILQAGYGGHFLAHGKGNSIGVYADAYLDASPGAGQKAVPFMAASNGTELMRVESTGNVGIGITNPSTPLHISGKVLAVISGTPTGTYNFVYNAHTNSGTTGLQITSGTNYSYLCADDTNIMFGSNQGTTGNKVLISRSCPDNSLLINSSGNVGIGTTNPSVRLDVIGSSKFISDGSAPVSTVSPSCYVASGNSSDAPVMEIRQGRFNKDVLTLSTNQDFSASFLAVSENGVDKFRINGKNRSTDAGSTVFFTGSEFDASDYFVVQNNTNSYGRVGIIIRGKTFSGANTPTTNDGWSLGSGRSILRFDAYLSGDSDYDTKFSIQHLLGTGTNNTVGDLGFLAKTYSTTAPAMVLTGAGNVGIGITNPSVKLQVVGRVYASDYGYAREFAYDAPASPDGSGYVWIRASVGGFNSGGDIVKFSFNRSINANSNNPYGGPTLDVTGVYSREWHGGQEFFTATYGYHGSVPSSGWVLNAGPRDLAGGGPWFYMRVWAGVQYIFRYPLSSGYISPTWEQTTDPGNVPTINLGFNILGNLGSITASQSITAGGNITAYGSVSDRKLKENINPLSNTLDKILQLNPVTFDWKKETQESKMVGLKEDIGLIAQEVQEVFPELVREGSDGCLAIRERGLTAILIQAIKEQQKQMQSLKDEIEKMKDGN